MYSAFNFFLNLFTAGEAVPNRRSIAIRGVANNTRSIKGVINPSINVRSVLNPTVSVRGVVGYE